MALVSFRARARTIDHLGREQIADCPTAVSELWKNAYDAYARSVALHIFDGEVPVAAVVDNGHGMSRQEIEERWLVVGTEAKTEDRPVPVEDRCGLDEERIRQGQKGIGRLSAAFLGPVVLVLSRRAGHPFVAMLVDWRVFENPFLHLDDVAMPIEEFESREAFPKILDRLFDEVISNLWRRANDLQKPRVTEAWERFDALEHAQEKPQTTSEAIAATALRGTLTDRHLRTWDAWAGRASHGTALFVLGLHRELGVWVDPEAVDEDDEVKDLKESLRSTLDGFVDPYTEFPLSLEYRAVAHWGPREHIIVSSQRPFGLQDLRGLEHVVEGTVNATGVFSGRVRSLGRDRGNVVLDLQRRPPARSAGWVGPFDVTFGTFEVDAKNSTHPQSEHEVLEEKAKRYGGLGVYRDSLRVQPYGRPAADFFGMEERRSRHAGREFWSYRRTFGRIAITRRDNPNLRDKAGREGFIDNRARRELRLLVVSLLRETARRYFGTDAQIRKEELPEVEARNQRARESEQKVARKTRVELRKALQERESRLAVGLTEVREVRSVLEGTAKDEAALRALEGSIEELRRGVDALRLPPHPRDLGALEERYRAYRDQYVDYRAHVDALTAAWNTAIDHSAPTDPREVAQTAATHHTQALENELEIWARRVLEALQQEGERMRARATADKGRYVAEVRAVVKAIGAGHLSLTEALTQMEEVRQRWRGEFASEYEPYLRAVEHLSNDAYLSDALVWSTDERAALERKVEQVHQLAQLGITVEIIGHELEDLDSEMRRNFDLLPLNARKTEAFRLAQEAQRTLSSQLRFLNPLNLSEGYRRQTITGEDIYRYVVQFFQRRLEVRHIILDATPAFLAVRLTEYFHRVVPVFINLINNACYWLTFVEDRRILLDQIDDSVIVADTGPGVDPDDVERLFELFFTRRAEGRGVGLYLCRVNLVAGGHNISYAVEPQLRILGGANFVLRFREMGQ